MENASKALLIAGAILLCILIIAIGMFIYNSAQSTITDSLTTLSTQEIEALNSQFLPYEGIQKGTNVKNLMGKLIANANTYADEPLKIPLIYFRFDDDIKGVGGVVRQPGNVQSYMDACGKIRNMLNTNREYNVFVFFQNNGLIDVIYIYWRLDFDDADLTKSTHREDFLPKRK